MILDNRVLFSDQQAVVATAASTNSVDLKALGLTYDKVQLRRRQFNKNILVVAAIGGCCLGAGLELALACHYRVCATNATLGFPESSFGLMPGCGGTIRLPALVGRAAAMRMILDAQSVRAEEARAMGLVDVVVHKRELTRSAAALIRSATRRCA